MPSFGGHAGVFPIRFGGAKPTLETVHKGLLAGRGTAYDISEESPVWAEDMAVARALTSVWQANELLANQATPLKLSVLLERWEKILGLPSQQGGTLAERRAAVHALVSRTGVAPTYQELLDRLKVIFAPVTVTIEHKSPGGSGVITSWPGGWYVQSVGTTPPVVTLTGQPLADYKIQIDILTGATTFQWSSDNGLSFSAPVAIATDVVLGSTGLTAHFPVGAYNADNQYFASPVTIGFYSTVANITIVTTKPSTVTIGQYISKLRSVAPLLESFLPAWIGYSIILDGTVAGQFMLDEDLNLDFQRLG